MVKLRLIPYLLVFSVFTSESFAGFDWGAGCEGGSGTFQQYIQAWNYDPENAVTVGTIPSGMKNVYISLKSDKDVDIRIYDANGTPVVHWPDGILNSDSTQSTVYNNVTIKYSGYNGDGTGLGHEYIKVTGTTQNAFIMKAFGYEAGHATVDYSWDANEDNCGPAESGGGSFQQQILNNDVVKVGDIPHGINNLSIQLISDKDVDIQLYDKDNGTKIVVWPDGILKGDSKQSTNYQGMTIEWSGYNGDGTGLGHEYIKITGNTTRNLTMMAYGYQAGYARVEYSWGDTQNTEPVYKPISSGLIDYPILPYVPGSYDNRSFYYDEVHLGEDIDASEGTAIRAIADGYIVEYRAAQGYGNLVAVIEHSLDSSIYNTSTFHFYEGHIKTKNLSGSKFCGIYGHLRSGELNWKVGDFVEKGQVIGYIENKTYNGDGAEHLHLGIFAQQYPGTWAFYGYAGNPSYAKVKYFVSGRELIEKLQSGLDIYDFWRIADPIYHGTQTNFDAQFKLQNITKSPITVEKWAIAIHSYNGSHLFDVIKKEEPFTLQSGQSTYGLYGENAIFNAGQYKVVAKVYLNGRWFELASQDIVVK